MKNPPGNEFKVNDIVSFGGVRGVVATTKAPHEKLTMQVMFPNQKLVIGFFPDGRFLEWHKESSLSFIKRNKLSILNRIKEILKGKKK